MIMDENILHRLYCFLMLIVFVDCTIFISVNDKVKSLDAEFGGEALLVWRVMDADADEHSDPSENFTLSFFFIGDHLDSAQKDICKYDSKTLHGKCNYSTHNRMIRFHKPTSNQFGFAIPQINSQDAGYYECEYKSLSSTEKARVYLNITGIPPSPRIVLGDRPTTGNVTHLTCVPGVDNRTEDKLPLRITWYIDPRDTPARHVINNSQLYVSHTGEDGEDTSYTCDIQEHNNTQIYGPSEAYVIKLNEDRISTSVRTPNALIDTANFLNDKARMVIGIVPAVLGIIICASIVLGSFVWRNRTPKKDTHHEHLKSSGITMGTNTSATLCATGGATSTAAGHSMASDPVNYRAAGSCAWNIYESVSMDDVLGPDELDAYRRRVQNLGVINQLANYDDIEVSGKDMNRGVGTDYENIHPVSTLSNNPKFGFSKLLRTKAQKAKRKAQSSVTQQKVQPANISTDNDMDGKFPMSSLSRASRCKYNSVAAMSAFDSFPRGAYSLQRELGGNRPGQLMYKYAYDEVHDACAMEQHQNNVNDSVDSCLTVSTDNLVVDNGRYETQRLNEYCEVKKNVRRPEQHHVHANEKGKGRENDVASHPSLENLTIDNHSYGDM